LVDVQVSDFPAYKTVSTDLLIPYARNSRTHSKGQVDKIAASIKEFGFLNPIIVDGENGIIAGHGRVMAAQKLGLDTLPVIEASHLTDAQRRAYVIADNRLALDAGWDDEMLRVEFSELAEAGFDLELTGFDADELDDISTEIEDVPPDQVGRANEHGRLERYLEQDIKMIRLTYSAEEYDLVYDAIIKRQHDLSLDNMSDTISHVFLSSKA
jgi:hypothetical protein